MSPITDPELRERTEHCIAACNTLLRGEISAVETYGQAVDKFSTEPEVGLLLKLRQEHQKAVDLLKEQVIEMHGLPETDSGAWGGIAKAIQGTANLFGEGSAIRSLLQGEELGQRAYEGALEDEQVLPECKATIRDQLLPMVNHHIVRLETAIDSVSR